MNESISGLHKYIKFCTTNKIIHERACTDKKVSKAYKISLNHFILSFHSQAHIRAHIQVHTVYLSEAIENTQNK